MSDQTVSEAPAAPQETPKPAVPVVPAAARPVAVKVDNRSRRSDDDALEGHFAKVVAGEHAGRIISFEHVTEVGEDGYPLRILGHSRDAKNEVLVLDYSDVRPADPYHGGR